MVRSRLFWLKSTKIRSPRSSFHQAVVTPPSRRSSSRPKPMAAWRTSSKRPVAAGSGRRCGCRGCRWSWDSRACRSSASSSRATSATRRASANVVPGCGSRSSRSSSGWSTSGRRTGHGWKRQRTHLRRPDQRRRLGRAELVGRAPARKGDRRRSRRSRARPWAAASGRSRRRRGPAARWRAACPPANRPATAPSRSVARRSPASARRRPSRSTRRPAAW